MYQFLNELAGANRYLWNAALAKTKKDYEDSSKSKISQFELYKWYKAHKHEPAPWLAKYPVTLTQTGLAALSDADQQFFRKKRQFPQFKKEDKTKKTFYGV